MLFRFGLAVNTQLHAGDGFATRLRNRRIALFAKLRRVAGVQTASGTLYGVFNACVNLILYGAVARPAACHCEHLNVVSFTSMIPVTARFVHNPSRCRPPRAR